MNEKPLEEEVNRPEAQEAPEQEPASLAEPTQNADELRAMLQRVQADFVNYKRRAEQEREEMLKFFNAGLISRLLPVLDELGMALDQAPAASPDSAWTEGVKLINRKLHILLESEGVTPIEAEGKAFDPLEHEALGFRETSEHQEGQVIEVVRPGYKLNGRMLRPAQVIVASALQAAK